jgi:hypothetical protein
MLLQRRRARREIAQEFSIGRWLSDHPAIRAQLIWRQPWGEVLPYNQWPNAYAVQLSDAYLEITHAINDGRTYVGLPDTPALAVTPAGGEYPRTLLDTITARQIYMYHAAWSLAVEVEQWVPWRLDSFASSDLALLFDSASLFKWSNAASEYEIHWADQGRATPGDPLRTYAFLESNFLIADSEPATTALVVDWCRNNLRHYLGADTAANYLDIWQFAGLPPVERIISGTTHPVSGFAHWTGGCWGTTGFLRDVLRCVNIPVALETVGNHCTPGFTRLASYMSHGDDPYNILSFANPQIPAENLLIDQATFDAWFGSSVPFDAQNGNVGRRVAELAVQYLSNHLLWLHCQDLAAGNGHAASQVFATLQRYFTLFTLEAVNLWGRMDDKIAALGGCASVPFR